MCDGLPCRNVNIELSERGVPVKVLCPGGEYDVKVRQQQWGQHHLGQHLLVPVADPVMSAPAAVAAVLGR